VLMLLASASLVFSQRAVRPGDEEVRRLVERIRTETDHFRRSLDSALDRRSLDDSRAEDRINEMVREFDRSTDRLRGHPGEVAAVQEALDRAVVIDRFVYRRASTGPVFDDWMSLRADLDHLADIYGVAGAWTATGVAAEPARQLAPSRSPQRINDRELKAVISRIDSEADRFRRSLRDALNHSRVKHSDESDINRYVKNFDTA